MNRPMTINPTDLRIGQGYDVHAFAEGRRLVLGGVDIPHVRGLLGHSDADVLAHAVADALLGGIRGGDIGKLFPDDDPAFKDADSLKLLAAVADKINSLHLLRPLFLLFLACPNSFFQLYIFQTELYAPD